MEGYNRVGWTLVARPTDSLTPGTHQEEVVDVESHSRGKSHSRGPGTPSFKRPRNSRYPLEDDVKDPLEDDVKDPLEDDVKGPLEDDVKDPHA
ncbi:hypothetical protein Pcinc_042374 [Petrolisthes cinctipes]|uniref:Uncharacterized protein n=1 Tax=Petrolisthes cinctipes TaxID=88211 RepID=A0AAE1EIX4_PETCI|nr:hypothetical protein Pcinc_042374 [Petrolisthes cinctipes]